MKNLKIVLRQLPAEETTDLNLKKGIEYSISP